MRIKLNVPLMLSEIASALSAPPPKTDKQISYVSTDTRKLFEGDLFIALIGKHYDASDFTDEAIKKGAYVVSKSKNATVCINDINAGLIQLISLFISKLPLLKGTVAITGSVGKTTTKEFATVLLSKKYRVHATEKNYNNLYGVLFTILSAPLDTEILIFECGMNARGEIKAISIAIMPTVALITNIGHAHIGKLGSREEIARAKLEITEGLSDDGVIYLPKEEPLLNEVKNALYFSTIDKCADVCLLPKECDRGSGSFKVYTKDQYFSTFKTDLVGEHILSCLCSALAIALQLDIDEKSIRCGIKSLTPSILRQKMICQNGYKIYDDTYSASPEAMYATLKMLSLSGSPITAVLGDMLELGEHSKKLHFELGQKVASLGIARLYSIGKFAQDIAKGARSSGMKNEFIHVNTDANNLEKSAESIVTDYKGEIILLKASHEMHLERIREILTRGD